MHDLTQLVNLLLPVVERGWQGLVTVFIAWTIYRDVRQRRNGHNGNPSPEIHAALHDLREALRALERRVDNYGERISRLEGIIERERR